MRSGRVEKLLVGGVRVAVLGVACLIVLVPLIFLMLNSVKLPREFLTVPPTILPSQLTLEHYRSAFGDPETRIVFMNSLVVATLTTVISIVVGTLSAYALARLKLSTSALSAILFVFLFIR